ncbi:hypothetical protein [Mycolicibacterium fortuitum]|uniref:hypothetical protein n=1 Tax=Mycolicibacterium fortuitum TaxID=1766 RepID=UPI0010423540|nr:hypothetical protein [Mycolicibacterium fortuitum]
MPAAQRDLSRGPGDRIALAVGAASGLIGTALVIAPRTTGERIGIVDRTHTRLVGAIDLALGIGLLAGHPRWAWLATRAATNIATAAWAITVTTGTGHRRRATVFGAALCVATLGDIAGVIPGPAPTEI